MVLHEELVGLFGSWIHAHEEDEGERMVFRRVAPADLPPSRGRLRFEIGAAGALLVYTQGADDRPLPFIGYWRLDLDRQTLELEYDDGIELYRLESLVEDRLVLIRL